MTVKVGPLRSAQEAELASAANIVGVRVGSASRRDDRAISEETLDDIRSATPAQISLQVNPLALDQELIGRCSPDYVEFQAADPEKLELLDRQLAAVTALYLPFIATGLHLAKDDLWLLGHGSYLDRLLSAGARYLEVELDSTVDPDFRFDAALHRRAEELFDGRPILITDNFTELPMSASIGESGVFLNIGIDRARPQTFAFSTALRLLRTRGGAGQRP